MNLGQKKANEWLCKLLYGSYDQHKQGAMWSAARAEHWAGWSKTAKPLRKATEDFKELVQYKLFKALSLDTLHEKMD